MIVPLIKFSLRRIILLLVFLSSSCFPSFAGHHSESTILVLHSYHAGLKWTADIDTGIRSTFNAAGESVNLHIEYLDTKRFQLNTELQSHLEHLLTHKLSQFEFDLVILSDNNAFNFVLRHRNDLFRDKPVVFCGVNGFTPKMIEGFADITGVAESPQVAATLELARKFHPNLDEVVVVGGEKSVTGRLNYALFLEQETKFPDLHFTYWNDFLLEDLLERLRTLGGNRLLMLTSVTKDRSGRVYSFAEVAEHIRAGTNLPLYGLWDFYLGHGIVGGKLINGEAQGNKAAELANKILHGSDPDDLPIVFTEGTSYLFDDRELQRFNISSSQLPEKSVVYFRAPSSYEIDKRFFLFVVGAFIVLVATTTLLARAILRRRRTEKALSASESLLTSFCDVLPDNAFIVDEQGVYVEVLSAQNELTYIDPATIKGRAIIDIFPPFIAGVFLNKLEETLRSGELVVFEYPLSVPAGNRFFEARLLPMPEIKGQLRMIIWIARDVTQRREIEENLEERARLALLEAEIALTLVEGKTLERTLDLCCTSLVDFSGAIFGRIWTLNAANNILELKASVGLYTHTNGTHSRIKVGQGKLGHVVETGRPHLTNDIPNDPLISDRAWALEQGIVAHASFPLMFKGELVGAVVLFFREKVNDATFEVMSSVMNKLAVGLARFNAEEELQLALIETNQSRERLDTILRSVADGLIVTDTRNHVVMINRAAENLIGADAGKIVGQSIEKALSDRKVLGGLTSVLLGEKPFESLVVDMVDQAHDTIRLVEARIAPVRRKSGNFSGAVTILRDVTREREIDRMKSEFISIAAHELRTPLTTVLGYAELLLNEVEMGGFDVVQRREFLGYIYEKAEVLKRIIDDTLDIGRIEARRPILLEKNVCEMVHLVRSTLEHLRKENSQHVFEMDCPAPELLLNLDQQKIMQVLDNLLNNAVKYSPGGGLVKIAGRMKNEMLCISVIDQGIGMTPEQVALVFDKFYRADSSDTAVGGLGLGMSICKTIVEAHGGKIWVDSVLEEGTTASFTLPIE